jgi:hypothetical protein
LAPHHTSATDEGDAVALRILFAAYADDEDRVRAPIDQALMTGALTGPDGRESAWVLESSGASPVRPDEADHSARLTQDCPQSP